MDISIIMPVYNAERFIREAIDGVLNQQFSGSYELLIADDQSSDTTPSILAQYATDHPDTIKVFNNVKNLGCSSNSISLAKRATGKYLAFCDSDDVWLDAHKLQKQFEFLENNKDYAMVCTNANLVDENSRTIHETQKSSGDADIEIDSLIRKNGDVFNSSIMMRADFYRTMLDDCSWFEAHDCFFDSIWSWYAAKNSKLRYMDAPMIAFRSLADSDSRSTNKEKARRLTRRYYMMKLAFVLQQHFETDQAMDIMMSEYDYFEDQNYKTGLDDGANQVRASKAYKLGNTIINPLRKIKK